MRNVCSDGSVNALLRGCSKEIGLPKTRVVKVNSLNQETQKKSLFFEEINYYFISKKVI